MLGQPGGSPGETFIPQRDACLQQASHVSTQHTYPMPGWSASAPLDACASCPLRPRTPARPRSMSSTACVSWSRALDARTAVRRTRERRQRSDHDGDGSNHAGRVPDGGCEWWRVATGMNPACPCALRAACALHSPLARVAHGCVDASTPQSQPRALRPRHRG